MTEKQGDLIFSGSGKTTGGSFHHVSMNGNGVIDGDVECNNFHWNGNGKVSGDVQAQLSEINGNAKIDGSLSGEEVMVRGNVSITGNLNAKVIHILGNCKVHGNLSCDHLTIRGNLKGQKSLFGDTFKLEGRIKIRDNCKFNKVNLNGTFNIDGHLHTDELAIHLKGKCSASEIKSKKMKVVKKASFLWLDKLIPFLKRELRADVIEGDHIHIKNTKAKLVKGKVVYIGKACDIETVTYHDSLVKVRSAVVHSSEKTVND
ncbi:polymer-forming cytoskeletal protein [Evansella cellulosilytica]|uniref:Polymer-forming cytoskeletal protein n=1 Tax=Evansella cellulosilytica (strain ATCC 21833 / DSM 2522 / FERM P-1141 / JCM 9156 / N-4) TaxID=649639 RepID=E6TQT5_EVAC2|nr:polymer-forming cytoskeletal protein [Evansella cellulosilytica]ADU31710.1 protein of unknown function DUF583 [Evansella cellulosilytica DSM 2522]